MTASLQLTGKKKKMLVSLVFHRVPERRRECTIWKRGNQSSSSWSTQRKGYLSASACTIDKVTLLMFFPTRRAFRKIKTPVSLALDTSANTRHWLSSSLNLRVILKYEKMRFLATLRRATFYISLSRGSAIGKLLNVNLLAYASDDKLYSTRADFPNHANCSSQKKLS